MKLKQAIGVVFHKLLDWKTVVNPITAHWYPQAYVLSHRKRKLYKHYIWTSPMMTEIDRDFDYRPVFPPFNIPKDKFNKVEFIFKSRPQDNYIVNPKVIENSKD
ncbi:MAG: hypothetical protein ACFE9L_17805 [Candidatus Hodarchaeota archaeon]